MINKSFQLLRTNPALTTNIKLVVTSDYKLYLESFDTNKQLSDQKFKHFSINKNHLYEDQLIRFYNGLSSQLAFDVKYDSDNTNVFSTYNKQFDDIYWSGAKAVEDNWYSEDFEYLAPLFIRKGNLPDGFVILRVDEPTSYDNIDNLFGANELNKDNFYSQIVDKWKCVKFFDMRYQSDLGYFLDNNYVENTRFPEKSFELDFRQYEYSKFYGIDYLNGVYVTKSKFLQDLLYYEQPHFKLEKTILDSFRSNNLVFPHILNFKFLYNDVPSTPDQINNYSLNRYYGFFIDNLEFVTNLTSYVTPDLKPNYMLKNNIFGYYTGNTVTTSTSYLTYSTSPLTVGYGIQSLVINSGLSYITGQTVTITASAQTYNIMEGKIVSYNKITGDLSVNILNLQGLGNSFSNWIINLGYLTFVESSYSPFVEGWYPDKTYWIQYQNDFYQVKKLYKDDRYVYQIISDFDMSGLTFSSVNDRTCFINYQEGNYNCRTFENPSGYTNLVSGYTTNFKIDPYYENGNVETMFADLYLIEIDGNYHVLKERDGNYFIQSDYAINSFPDSLKYWKGGKNSKYYTSKPIYSFGEKPLSYPVYRLNFSDIKDFDFNRVNTHFADFDYEKDTYYVTDEHKLYATDYTDTSVLNKSFMVHPRGEDGQYQIMNVSSEYVADDELYEISFNDLTDIWRKNQSVVKWGFNGSNSNCDYPYKLNNSIDIGDIFNSTSNILSSTPLVIEKNLDYFYRIGNFISGSTSNIMRYLNQTTNIEVDLMDDFSKKFNLDMYLKSDVDYFDYFFRNKSYFNLEELNFTKLNIKYSTFQSGDKYTPSSTLFKGLNINLFKVSSIERDSSGKILNIITDSATNFNNYKFAIILNDVYEYYNTGYTSTIENGLSGNTVIDKNVNGIHVFLNDKYQNILIVINVKIPIQQSYINLNNVPIFGEKFGLYNSKTLNGNSLVYPATANEYNPALITAANFIDCFDDMNTLSEFDSGITFYYINRSAISGSTGPINVFNTGNTMKDIPDWGKLDTPFILTMNSPELLETKKQSYIKGSIKGPSINIYDKYLTYYDSDQKQKYNVVEPLGRYMNLNIEENNLNTVYAYNKVATPNAIYRFNGTYEPIFSNIAIFNNTYIYYSGASVKQWDSNYKFDTSYENFGRIEELIYSKVNPSISPLKLKETDKDRSIYPMVDEFGYQFSTRFIFNSSWDHNFYVVTNSDQNINKQAFSNLSNFEYIIDPIKPKN